jgi:hypothetical protein
MPLGPKDSAFAQGAHAEALEGSRCSGDEAGETQPPFVELPLHVPNAAEALPRLGHDLTAE